MRRTCSSSCYRAITESAHEIISECDDEGRVLYVSPAMATLLGYTPNQSAGTTPVTIVDPDGVEQIVGQFLETVKTGKPTFRAPFRCRHRDGTWRWLESQTIAYQRSDGERRFLTVTRDVTDRHNLEEQFQQAQRLEGLGVLAGGGAHSPDAGLRGKGSGSRRNSGPLRPGARHDAASREFGGTPMRGRCS
ncbi:MAG: PAS domain S-box protein [Myxococcota bacterium]|jgi:PAS domain S-box-containing protein|nr:PAS domain S-box protein [bacterium]MDP6074423.1 PAS domain S-box protein [Myxococcota bacterium]MDP7073808.1 PAS domain S-box protein [Myxococcota bacterium]MDP7300321.1 PAS domain S-box protein [Myxococcota bacterium]MDP7433133.1 PAS domain S-box protein [Myxococcota bacterium]